METLKDHRNRATVRPIDLSDVPLAVILQGREQYLIRKEAEGLVRVSPEDEALWFYLRNHSLAVLSRMYDPAEPLGAHLPLVVEYQQKLQDSSLRMFYYLLQICVRESRHAHTGLTLDQLLKQYPDLSAWYKSYHGTNSDNAVSRLLHHAPPVSLGYLTRFLVDAFYKCGYGSQYGGKKWGAIADVLKQFSHGEITAEMMMDTSFTLCHNGGPIFNKHMWYETYNLSALQQILDVQRAGMIPIYIAEIDADTNIAKHYSAKNFITTPMKEYVKAFAAYSTEFSGQINWTMVKKLGALGSLDHLISAQKSATPPLSMAEQIKAKKQAAIEAQKQAQAEAEAAALVALQWQVMPNVYATKFQPDRVELV